MLNNDNYNAFTLQGRFFSALADTIVILLIYKSVKLLEDKYKLNSNVKYLASFSYATFVLPIQLSHFFITDTFLNLFLFSSFFFALSYFIKRSSANLIISAIFFGLSISTKISAIYLLPLILSLLITPAGSLKKSLLRFVGNVFLFGIISFFISKLAYPYMYYSSNIFDPRLNPDFLKNINTLKILSQKTSIYPPNIQWINKIPIIFPLKNLILFGIGIPAFILFVAGLVNTAKIRAGIIFSLFAFWIVIFFIYQGTQTVMTLRYFLIIYPFIAIFVGIGLDQLTRKINKIAFYLLLIAMFISPLMFLSIYTKPHTRTSATNWILENIPYGATLLTEHWDDSLPLTGYQNYKVIQLPVFDQDTDGKWKKMTDSLSQGDYYILSSNRAWGSISRAPEKYPRIAKFYKDLFYGKLEYKKIKEFTSYPSLSYLGIPITFPDDFAEENFTVFDHPKVMIFKKTIINSFLQEQ